jgi:hypothetical protein
MSIAGLPALTNTDLFRLWDPSALKLYIWLRDRAIRSPRRDPVAHGFLTVDATNSELELAIDISKNTITKLTRILQDLRVCTVTADRNGYHFRLGECVTVPSADLSLPLTADIYYLDALVSRSDPAPSLPGRGNGAGAGRA